MADATVKLDANETREAIAAAVAATLTPEAMREVMAGTLAKLMEPRGYGDKMSQFQDLFSKAVTDRAAVYINELVSVPGPLRERLDDMVKQAMGLALGDLNIRNKIARNIAAAIGLALSSERS